MLPILLKIGPFTIHTYGVMMAIGVGLALWFILIHARKQGINIKILADGAFYTLLISLVGAKLVLLAAHFSEYISSPAALLSLARSGGVFQGGLTFGLVFALWYFHRYRIPTWKTADIISPGLALGHGFGRLGCFSASCCYGRPSGLPWSVTFTNPYSHELTGVPLDLALHPVQLYEAGLNFLNFLILWLILKKKNFNGQVFAFYIINYSLIRYFTEFYRGDHSSQTFLILTSSPYTSLSFPQLFCLLGLIAGITLFFILRSRRSRGEAVRRS
ncbi:MAG: prolipoprotein diacylglyceryl transferase [Candidatus Aminicenantes bacterium]|nr:prolipoprotein diacylglyceryl transferase [Candidatus Aminicenantes bacterium]